MSNNKTNVIINKEVITLKSGEDEDYLHRLARYTDKKISEINAVKSTAMLYERKRTVLIAVNIADDYFKEHEKALALEAKLKKYESEIGGMEEENRLLNETVMQLQGQLEKSREELDEYIENFDGDSNVVSLPKRAVGGFR